MHSNSVAQLTSNKSASEGEIISVPVPSKNKLIPLQHIKQKNSWDCGVTCIKMVLPIDKYQYFCNHENEIMSAEGINSSTWTIDLAFLLKRLDVRMQYSTNFPGIRASYYKDEFYIKNVVKDEKRVINKFESAKKMGVDVIVQSLHLNMLLQHVFDHGPVIVLTNANLLKCVKCGFKEAESNTTKVVYHGHYVVLVGFILENKRVVYKNPSSNHSTCEMSFVQFNDARHCLGTDDDILLIYKI